MTKLLRYIVFLSFSIIFTSCSEEISKHLAPPPTAFGTVNHITVVADEDIWESAVGDSLRYYYSSAFPILPQPEPIFDLIHFTPKQLDEDKLRKELRTYIILADLNDETSATTQLIFKDVGREKLLKTKTGEGTRTRVAKDRWAEGQMVIYMFANGREDLIDNLKANFPAASKRINEADREMIKTSTYQAGINKELTEEIERTLNLKMTVPNGYFLAINDKRTVWIRQETDVSSTNIMIHKVKYTEESQLSKEGIKILMDTLGQKYVSSEIDGSFMHINDIDLPMIIKKIDLQDYYTLESRGIWEMVNDFMGGPFLSYLIHDRKANELILINGFIYAPGKKKRKFIQNLECIMSSTRIL